MWTTTSDWTSGCWRIDASIQREVYFALSHFGTLGHEFQFLVHTLSSDLTVLAARLNRYAFHRARDSGLRRTRPTTAPHP